MGCEKPQTTPGILLQFAIHRRNQLPLCPGEMRAATVPSVSDPRKYSVLKNPVLSVPSSGRPYLARALRHFGERNTARSLAWFIRRMPSVGPVLDARVPRTHKRALIQVGQKFRTDGTAVRQQNGNQIIRPARFPPLHSDVQWLTARPCDSDPSESTITGLRHSWTPFRNRNVERTGAMIIENIKSADAAQTRRSMPWA
jgi:hypothetical protein